MATDPISEYQTALREFEQATRRVERIVGIISDASSKLGDWQRVSVANINVGFPAEILRGPSINGSDWPTAQQLAEALSQYHSTLHEAGNTYRRIPADQRGVIQPPPES